MGAGGQTFSGISLLILFGVITLILLIVGIVFILISSRRGVGYPACGKCGYNVQASIESGSRCPECGSEFADVGITPPARGHGRNKALLVIGIMLIILSLGCLGSSGIALFGSAVRSAAPTPPARAVGT